MPRKFNTGSDKNINYGGELLGVNRRRKCSHCEKLMIVSDRALNGYKRKLLVVRTNGKYCPYCRKEIYPKKPK